MKNQLGFIPDNISAISNVSLHIQANHAHEIIELNHDSTDNLVEEILRQRAGRQMRQELPQQKIELGSFDDTNKKLLMEIKDSQDSVQPNEIKLRQSLRSSSDKQGEIQILPHDVEVISQKAEKDEEMMPPPNQSNGSIHPSIQESKKQESMSPQIEDKIETLNNQTNQQFQHLDDKDHEHEEEDEVSNKFMLPRIDKINNQSIEHTEQNHERSLRLNMSLNNFEKKQEDIGRLATPQENLTQDKMISPEKSRIYHHNSRVESQKSEIKSVDRYQREIAVIQSQIEIKNNNIQVQPQINAITVNKGNYNYTPTFQNTEDQELVMAITASLNKMDKLQMQETQQIPRKSIKNNNNNTNSQTPANKQDLIGQSRIPKEYEQFETNYSEDIRDLKILQHRYQSNLQYILAQTKEMTALYQMMIMQEEKKQTKKDILDLQMMNRREKISLRTASYSKRFNFHSPIPKNNNKPLQFRKKFMIVEHKLSAYEELKRNIAREKEKHKENDDLSEVLSKYYEMAKEKKITSNMQREVEYIYNSRIGKFETHRQGFTKKDDGGSDTCSIEELLGTQYEFDKTKRTLNFNKTQISYYQLLKYKVDISRDMILETQVFNMGKIKKLKDENRLLSKQLQYINHEIMVAQKAIASAFKDTTPSESRTFSKTNARFTTFKVVNTKKALTQSPFARLGSSSSNTKLRFNTQKPGSGFQSLRKSHKSFMSSNVGFKRDSSQKNLSNSKGDLENLDFSPIAYKSNQTSDEKSPKRRQFCAPSFDQYGLGDHKSPLKAIEEIPTFGKKQDMKLNSPKSPSKSKNIVRHEKDIKTEYDLRNMKSKSKHGKISQQASPRRLKMASPLKSNMGSQYCLNQTNSHKKL